MKRIRHPVCVGCGSSYSFTKAYKGNYCPDCHTKWTESSRTASRDPSPRSVHPRGHRSVRRLDESETSPTDEDAEESSQYDEE
jgi:predicted amidophosphoribosyltransferase